MSTYIKMNGDNVCVCLLGWGGYSPTLHNDIIMLMFISLSA